MVLKIKSAHPRPISIIEGHIFKDKTGNDWRVEVTNSEVYLIYEGKIRDRFASLRVMSDNNTTMKVPHNNIFASNDNSFETYYEIRNFVLLNDTISVWANIQKYVLNEKQVLAVR